MGTYNFTNRTILGMERFFEEVENFAKLGEVAYPPYNVITNKDETSYTIEVAVAGFSKDDVSVSLDDGVLIISGKLENTNTQSEDVTYVHKGISAKKFTRKFKLMEHLEVERVSLMNGVLRVQLVKNIPEAAKPKTFTIE